MRDQDGYTVSGSCCDGVAFGTRDECVAFELGEGVGCVGFGNHSHVSPVHLPLLE
jgi:hypothetical protein